ncbi:MAG: cation diffusion facilitator family transporter [Myxococcota bacterium]
MSASATSHIIQSLFANLGIVVAKGIAAAFTGSGAMLAETIHSFADCGNQLLLLMGVKRAAAPPDAKHPLGYGRNLYFWSFMVALLLFVGGGVFSVYEGLHKIEEPEAVENLGVGLAILGVSLLLEGWSCWSNVVEINKRRGSKGFVRYLVDTKDSDLIVVFGENSAAVLGLVLATASMLAASITGDGRWDGFGSLCIGIVLIGVAVFLAVEVKSLLVGEAADPGVEEAARRLAVQDPKITRILDCITVQQGPGEVLVAIKIAVDEGLSIKALCDVINAFEVRLRSERPEAKWVFVEPDMPWVTGPVD